MTDIATLMEWCRKAREILAETGKSGKRAQQFEKALLDVQQRLQELKELAGQTPLVKQFHDEFERLAADANRLDQTIKGKPIPPKEKREKAKKVLADLEKLDKSIAGSKPAKETLEVRRKFFVETKRVRDRLQEESTHPLANTTQIEQLLEMVANAEEQVRSDPLYVDNKRVEQKTKDVAGYLAGLVRREVQSKVQAQQLDLKQQDAKGRYPTQRVVVQRTLDELDGIGQLTPEMKSRLEKALQAAEGLAAKSDWIGAMAELAKAPTREQCSSAFLGAVPKVKEKFAEELQQIDHALQLLESVLDEGRLGQFRAQRNQLLSQIAQGGDSIKQITAERQKLKAFVEQLAQSRREGDECLNAVKLLIGTLKPKVAAHADKVSLVTEQENQRQFELVLALREQRQHAEALSAAQALERALQSAAQTQAVAAHQAWKKVEGELRGQDFINGLKIAGGNLGLPADVREQAATLLRRIGQAQLDQKALVRDWTGLTELHAEVRETLAGLGKAQKDFGDFAPQRLKADQAMKLKWTEVEQALGKLQQSLTQAGADADPALQPLRASLKTLQGEWALKLASASSALDLAQPDSEKAVAGLLQQIAAAGQAKAIEATRRAQREAQGAQAFREALALLEQTELAALRGASSSQAMALATELTGLEKKLDLETDPEAPWAGRIGELAQIKKRIVQATTQAGQECTTINQGLTDRITKLRQSLQTAQQSLKQKIGGGAGKFEPLFTALRGELDSLELLTKTTNKSAAEGNTALITALEKRVQQLLDAINVGSDFEGVQTGIKQLRTDIDKLDKAGLKKEAEATSTKLNQQYTDLEATIYGLEPAAMTQALATLRTALATAQTELTDIQDNRRKLDLLANGCVQRIQAFARQGFAEAYRKSLEQRVSAARKKGLVAAELVAAIAELEALAVELTGIEADPTQALKHQTQLLADQHAQAKLRREWESKSTVVEKTVLPRADRAVEDAGGDTGQVDEAKRMLKMAKKAADGGNFERALQVLTQLEARVAQIERNPAGTGLGDRKALPKHVEAYSAEVMKLRQAFDGFVKAALAKVPSEQQGLVQPVLERTVQGLKARLNPGLFKLATDVLTDSKAEAGRRREAREEALARLRETVSFINTHPTMDKLKVNPIAPLQGDLRVLDAALTRLEAHIRASVR